MPIRSKLPTLGTLDTLDTLSTFYYLCALKKTGVVTRYEQEIQGIQGV